MSGTVSIGASQTIANHWLPRRLAAYHQAFPNVQLEITIGNTQAIESAVFAGRVDVGLVEGPITHEELIRRVVDTDRPMLVVAAGSGLPQVSGDRIDLMNLSWVIREKGSGTRRLLEELCERQKVDFAALRVVLELPSNEAVCEAVEAGAGATIISEQVAGAALKAGRLRAVPVDLPQREFALLRHSERTLSPAQRALADALSDQRT